MENQIIIMMDFIRYYGGRALYIGSYLFCLIGGEILLALLLFLAFGVPLAILGFIINKLWLFFSRGCSEDIRRMGSFLVFLTMFREVLHKVLGSLNGGGLRDRFK